MGPGIAAPRARVGFLRAARVRDWAHFLLLPLAAYDPAPGRAVSLPALARGVFIAFAVLAFGYLLNGVADRHMDASAHKNPLVSGGARPSYRAALSALAASALAASLFAPWPVLAATAIGLGSGLAYSIGPRLKRYPVLGTLANATNFAPLLWVGLPFAAEARGMLPLTVSFTCLLLQNQLLHEAADRDDDRRGQVLTTFRLLGPRRSALTLALFGAALCAVVAATPTLAQLALPIGLVYGLAFPLALARLGVEPARMRRARLVHRFFCLATGAAIFVCLRL